MPAASIVISGLPPPLLRSMVEAMSVPPLTEIAVSSLNMVLRSIAPSKSTVNELLPPPAKVASLVPPFNSPPPKTVATPSKVLAVIVPLSIE